MKFNKFCKCNSPELVVNNHYREYYADGSVEDYVTLKCNICGKTSKKKHEIDISKWRCLTATNIPKQKGGR